MIHLTPQAKKELVVLARNEPEKIDGTFLRLNNLIDADAKLTGMGLAYAVGYCDVSMSYYFMKYPQEAAKWSEMLAQITPYVQTTEEIDIYFKAVMQSFIENDYFRSNGWFKDHKSLTPEQTKNHRRKIIDKYLQMNDIKGSRLEEYLQMSRKYLK